MIKNKKQKCNDDVVLISVGRKPFTKSLNIEKIREFNVIQKGEVS